MKRFLIKLIATTLLLIVILSSFGCFSSEVKIFENFLDTHELEISGYALEYSEEPLFFYKCDTGKKPKWIIEANGNVYTFLNVGPNICVAKGNVDIEFDYTNHKAVTENTKTITYEYMSERSVVAKSILDKIIEREYVHIAFYGLISFDEKLFIYQAYVNRDWMGYTKHIPPIIYEFDFENDTVKYAGYLKDFNYGEAGKKYENSWGEAFFDTPIYNMPIEFMAKIVKTN